MKEFAEVKEQLDRINDAITGYDPVLKERARDILITTLFADHPAVARAGLRRGRTGVVGNGSGGLAALLQRWSPKKASERALLGAYYLTAIAGDTNLTSQAINTELKNHGISVSNITRAIDSNLRGKPPTMTQVRKLGKTRQARKQYRITAHGLDYVERQLEPAA